MGQGGFQRKHCNDSTVTIRGRYGAWPSYSGGRYYNHDPLAELARLPAKRGIVLPNRSHSVCRRAQQLAAHEPLGKIKLSGVVTRLPLTPAVSHPMGEGERKAALGSERVGNCKFGIEN